jgi:hypothetical protein
MARVVAAKGHGRVDAMHLRQRRHSVAGHVIDVNQLFVERRLATAPLPPRRRCVYRAVAVIPQPRMSTFV